MAIGLNANGDRESVREQSQHNEAYTPVTDDWDDIQGMVKNNEPIGDVMATPKADYTTRCMFNNKHGFHLYDRMGGDLGEDCETLRDNGVDYAGFAEPNLDTTKGWIRDKMHRAVSRVFQHCKLEYGSSPQTHQHEYKPGGTLTVVVGRLVGRVLDSSHDYLGRWTRTVFAAKDGRCVTIYNTYQVCKGNPDTQGEKTIINQLYSVYCAEGRANNNPRINHFSDLSEAVKADVDAGHSLILGGDFNEDIANGTKGMSRLVQDCKLVDPIFYSHGIRNFNTYIRGSKTIDYIFVSEDLLDAVKACGYQPYNDMIISDHRACFVDFDTKLLFGSETQKLPKPSGRGLCSKKKHQVTTYYQSRAQHLLNQGFWKRMETWRLHRSIPEAESLDRLMLDSATIAAEKCKSFPPIPYSVEIIQMRLKVTILTIRLHSLYSKRSMSKQIKARMAKLNTHFKLPATIADCKAEKDKALKLLRATELEEYKTHKLRREYQLELQAKYEDAGDAKMAHVIKSLRHAEETRRAWLKCAAARGKTHKSGVVGLQVPSNPTVPPKECNDWLYLNDPVEIEEHLQSHLKKHFAQAEETDFRQMPLKLDTNFSADTATADDILEGGEDPYKESQLRWSTAMLLQHCKRDPVDNITTTLTDKQFDGKLKSWNERTSTSPSGLHLGHLKSYYAKHSLDPDSENGQKVTTAQNDIRTAHLELLNYALEEGYAYTRWNKIVNTLIPKDPGCQKIHRLRVIHLYEADYNLILGVKWRELLHHAVKHKLLNTNQFGSVPGRSAIDLCWMEEMEYEISKCCLHPMIKNDNDAASCYDRILVYVGNLLSRKRGMPVQVCRVQGTNLEAAKYYIKTMLGESVTFLEHTETDPWHGNGQGAGNSPTVWLFISSTLFDCYEKEAHGAIFESPDGSIHVKLFMTGFVDDTNSRTNDFLASTPPTEDELLSLATKDAQWWSDLLWSSGGKLEPAKSNFHHIRYDFMPSGEPVLRGGTAFSKPMDIVGGDGTITQLKPISCYTAHKSLGCHKDPRGSLRTQRKVLDDKCRDYARIVKSSPFNRREANMFYRSIFLSSVGYCLATTHFSESDLDQIQSAPTCALLQKSGYCSTTAKAIVYGPSKMGGVDFQRLYDKQGIDTLQQFIKHYRTRTTPVGNVTEVALAWAQYCAGTGSPILEDTATPLPHLRAQILGELRHFLGTIEATVEVDTDHVAPLQREHDQHIMDIVVHQSTFTKSAIRRINYCRLYFNVVTISDITNAAGTHIDSHYWNGTDGNTRSHTTWHKCLQDRPADKLSWTMWRKALQLFSGRQRKLKTPLGKWLHEPNNQRMAWPFYLDPYSNTFYSRQGTSLLAFSGDGRKFKNDNGMPCDTVPPTSYPVDTYIPPSLVKAGIVDVEQISNWLVQQPANPQKPTTPVTVPTDFMAYLGTLEAWEHDLFVDTSWAFDYDYLTIAQHISTQSFLVASDGASDPISGKASFGWVLADSTGQVLVTCSGPVYGLKPSSYRAEAYGVLSPTRMIHHLLKYHQLESAQPYTHWCDNKSVVKHSKHCLDYEGWYPNDSLKSDWDILQQITESFKAAQQTPTVSWVKSHQDDHRAFEDLPLNAQLNCLADAAADQYLVNHADDQSTVHRFPVNKAQVHMPDGTCTYKLPRTIRNARTEPPLIAKMLKDNPAWDHNTLNQIDWTAHGRANSRHEARKVTLTKYLHNILAVGSHVHRYDIKHDHCCPTCSQPQEDQHHLYTCPDPTRGLWRATMRKAIRLKLDKMTTHETIKHIILDGIILHFSGHQPNPNQYPAAYQHIVTSQNEIGWDNFLKGRLSLHFATMQEYHIKAMGDSATIKNGTAWSTQLATMIIEQWFLLWKQRNDDRHGKDLEARIKAQTDQIRREVEQLYERAAEVPEKVINSVFKCDLDTQLRKSHSELIAWLANWIPVVEASLLRQCSSTQPDL